jgi:uncharacterized protein DUF4282
MPNFRELSNNFSSLLPEVGLSCTATKNPFGTSGKGENIMAFCAQCGGQLTPGAANCTACGAATGAGGPVAAAAPAPARYVPPINAQQAAGFMSSLFDLSFTNFITPKIIKVLFVISIVLLALETLAIIGTAFMSNVMFGILALLIIGPLVFLFGVIYTRVVMEVLIQIFRGVEYLADIAKQGRR